MTYYFSIQSERLIMNPVRIEDYEFIRQLVNTEGWLKNIGDRNIHSIDASKAYIQKIIDSSTIDYWVVWQKDINRPIGMVSLVKRDYLEFFDIGFAFLPEYMGKGYAYEATNAVLQKLKEADITEFLAITIPGNLSSIKLLQKLGLEFHKEIETKDDKLHVYKGKVN
jgi:ribosomal-protein-alanine N-acetyltransferase